MRRSLREMLDKMYHISRYDSRAVLEAKSLLSTGANFNTMERHSGIDDSPTAEELRNGGSSAKGIAEFLHERQCTDYLMQVPFQAEGVGSDGDFDETHP